MAVIGEQYGPADLIGAPEPPRLEGLERRTDGRWVFAFRVSGDAVLRDGRRVEVYRRVEVEATDYWGRPTGRSRR